MELILVRHGLPERRDDTSDPPLSDVGHDQARRVAAWLAHEKVDAVVSSTMLRARQTAEPFAALPANDPRLVGTLDVMEEVGTSVGAVRQLEEAREKKGLSTDDAWFWR